MFSCWSLSKLAVTTIVTLPESGALKAQTLISKVDNAVEAAKRAEELRQEKDFYKLQLSDIDIQEIEKLGLGTKVIQDIVENNKNEYDLIFCFVDAKNEGAIRLYKKLGKVYDEEGPNDNGEYFVTFYDNGRWQLDN